MMKKLLIIICCFSIVTSYAHSQKMTGLEVIKENDKQFNIPTEESTMTMELINSSGKKRTRTVQRYSKRDEQRNTQLLIKFLSPADVKGSGFLSIEHSKKDESRYLYLPALKKARRMSAGEDSDSFMGSDFTYEDLDDMDFDKYSFKLLDENIIDGIESFIVEVNPNEEMKKTSGYSKRIYYVAKKTFVVHKIDFYDKHSILFKRLTYTDIRLVQSPSIYRAYTMTMRNLKTKHSTVLIYQNIIIKGKLDDNLFSVRNLERSN